LFVGWIKAQDEKVGSARERAIGWRTLEILINREVKRDQGSFDFPLSVAALQEKSDSPVRSAAELFLAQEFGFPYYFGTRKLASLASWNIEQFMRLAGDEFEEVVSSRIVRKSTTLNADRQDTVLRVASQALWNEIPRRARNGEKVLKLLDSIGQFCKARTYEPTAPYDPGVTGIAISMEDRSSLQSKEFLRGHPEYELLADVLAASIANNLLEPLLDYKVKGSTWMVLNLNRLLCVNFDLPLHYGGFKEQRLSDLYVWMTSGYKGKKAVVVGSNNSAHDICAALWEQGADVTMVQRSSTHISRSDTLMDLALGGLYSEAALKAGITTDKADLIFASLPYKVLPSLQVPVYEEMKKRDAGFYARLEKAGFMLDFGDDGSGLFLKYLRRGSGYYIDVGASDLVADGKIKLKSGVGVERIKEHSIVFSDGSELPADLIVFATGYGSMNGWAAQLISKQVADKVGKCWGLGSDTRKDPGPWEGELRNMWKPTHQEALWFHGGNLHQSRHYSQFLSLQLKARLEGIPTPVYGIGPVHHLS